MSFASASCRVKSDNKTYLLVGMDIDDERIRPKGNKMIGVFNALLASVLRSKEKAGTM